MSGQPHFELDASMKLFTELTTLAASLGAPPWQAHDLRGRGFILIVYRVLPPTHGHVIVPHG
jgi:hypothetical protein